jgi:hypothetical protein
MGVSVRHDDAPRLRVSAPGRDLFLPDARRNIDVALEANDDFGLASLQLRYTSVSGSGERFTFTDGSLPLQVARTDARSWSARGTLPLAALELRAGDMIVYHGEARDQRPGAEAARSDSYIIEITAPGALAAEGFSLDDEQDRYGISQQMVILKTERLLARVRGLPADSVAQAALALAAEQRSVRAEFVFMMGGELAEEVLEAAGTLDVHEEAHAAADEELLTGRLANRGRIELTRAIRSMSHAANALNAADLVEALKEERAALTHLQGAFARTRYILRALTERERLDFTRRLTGALQEARSAVRAGAEAQTDARVTALRAALAGVAELAGQQTFQPGAAVRVAEQAERVLQIDPSAEPLQRAADQLSQAARALEARQPERARSLLDQAATQLAAAVRAQLLEAPQPAPSLELRRLEGSLTDALRRPVGVR